MGGTTSTLKEITVNLGNVHVIDNEKIIYKTGNDYYPLAVLYFEETIDNSMNSDEQNNECIRRRTVELNLLKKWATEPLKFTGEMMGIDKNIKIYYEGFVIKRFDWSFDPAGPLVDQFLK